MTAKGKPRLSPATAAWAQRIKQTFLLGDHHELLLEGAATAWDRAQAARAVLAVDGPIYHNRFREPRPHPALKIEAQSLRRSGR